jgi:5-methylcytosine-specific restriction enzyme B
MANVNKIEQYNKGTVFPDSYEETYLATKHISDIKLNISNDVFHELKRKIDEKGLYFGDDSVLRNIIAGIIKGNIVLQGPPGTGKTTLAKIICEVFGVSYTEATANSDWTTYDSIGGLQPAANDEGKEVIEGKNGYVVSSVLKCCDLIVKNENDDCVIQGNWLILDELNRCEIDKVFGDLFTALGSDATGAEKIINLWYQKDENKKMIYIPNRYRIIGAMNNVDKNFVNDISQGLSRRFTFIDILPPEEKYFQTETQNAKKLARKRVIDKVEAFGKAIINDEYLEELDGIESLNEIESNMLELIKRIRYSHHDDESYLGLQIGTAQIIDLYESIYITLIVSDIENEDAKGDILKDIVDSAISSRIIPQLDGYDFNKLAQFFDALQSDSIFSYMKRTKEAIYRLIH